MSDSEGAWMAGENAKRGSIRAAGMRVAAACLATRRMLPIPGTERASRDVFPGTGENGKPRFLEGNGAAGFEIGLTAGGERYGVHVPLAALRVARCSRKQLKHH